jgi:hypothetical protein
MKRALISKLENGRICEVKHPGEEFEVTDDFFWTDVPEDTTTSDTYKEDGTIEKFDPVKQPGFAENAYKVARAIAYKSVGEQMDMMFKELATTGAISATGPWASHVAAVKEAIPKDNPQKVYEHIKADWEQRQAEAAKNQQ